jgi:hypothetical protein
VHVSSHTDRLTELQREQRLDVIAVDWRVPLSSDDRIYLLLTMAESYRRLPFSSERPT